MRLRKEQPDGSTKEIVIPNKPELIQRLVDREGWVEVPDEPADDPVDEG
jgi:hypothetical protein